MKIKSEEGNVMEKVIWDGESSVLESFTIYKKEDNTYEIKSILVDKNGTRVEYIAPKCIVPLSQTSIFPLPVGIKMLETGFNHEIWSLSVIDSDIRSESESI